jgi:hypothetical protein
MEEQRTTDEPGHVKEISRRELFPLAGKVAIGAAGLSVLTAGGLVIGCGEEKDENSNGATTSKQVSMKAPWPYEKLTEDEIMKEVQAQAYRSWFEKFCSYATSSGIILTMAGKVGEPYSSYPVDSMVWGHGGGVGWGATCGTLTGASNTIGLIVGGKTAEEMINDLFNWYTTTELPIYQPPTPKTEIKSVNASGSPLCHISVGKWMAKENVKFFSDQRKDRCARLSADVAKKAIEMLNQWKNGTYAAANPEQAKKHTVQMPAQNNCTECHGDNIPTSPGM